MINTDSDGYPPLSVTRISFIQLGELEQCIGLTQQHRTINEVKNLFRSVFTPWSTFVN